MCRTSSCCVGTQRSSSFFFEKKLFKFFPYIDKECTNYTPLYCEYLRFIVSIKIYISERNRDCGYFVINNTEGLSKSFNFLRGGIQKLIGILNKIKCLKRIKNDKKKVDIKNLNKKKVI